MLIESLDSGGAERQMCNLAVAMKRRGYDVQVVTYAPGNFYSSLLDSAGVRHIFLGGNGTLQWLPRVRKFLRTSRHDVVLAFLESCSSYAELAALPFRNWGLVVSERSAYPQPLSCNTRSRKWFHLLANAVTTNSHTNRLMLEKAFPMIRSRTVTVYNTVDLDKFRPDNKIRNDGAIRLVVAARFNKQKNVLRAIESIALVRDGHKDVQVSVDWFGNAEDDRLLWNKCKDLIMQLRLEDCFKIHTPTQDIVTQYQQADAVWLPSLYEGIPNTICEAMACGKPILMSDVCDAGNLVKEGKNGFLFFPEDPSAIAEAICKFASLTAREKQEMGERSRVMAEQYFNVQKFTDIYESILYSASKKKHPDCGHWLPEIPKTALDFVKRTYG